LPHVPIVGYLTRSLSAIYALHGALLVFIRRCRRYLPVVRFLAVAESCWAAMLGIDFAVGMPLLGQSGRAERDCVQCGDSLDDWAKRFPTSAPAA